MSANTLENAGSWFWPRVEKTNGGCWIWKGATLPTGYGLVSFEGKPSYVHRIAYLLAHSSIPDKAHVCHSCDNPSCVNPSHLWSGTRSDNMRDMVVKERGASIKLSRAEVIEVRNRYETGGITQAELARQYNVSAAAVSRAVCGGSWHLTDGPIGEKKKHAERSVNLRDPDKVRAIRTAAATEHITYQELAYRFNVSLMTAYNIVKRKTWRHLE